MKCTTQSLGSTEEHTSLSWRVQLPDTTEDHVPVGTAEVGRGTQTSNRILVRVGIVNHDVGGIIGFYLRCQIGVNLNALVDILGLNSEQQRSEPLERAKVTADPEEVHLGKTGLALGVVHAVPDGLENRGERRNTDTSTDEHGNLVLEHILRCRAERSVDVNAGKDTTKSRVDIAVVAVDSHHVGSSGLLVELAAQRLSQRTGEVTHHTDVDGNVVLLGSTGQGEGVVLPDRDFRAVEENVLASPGLGVLLLDLNLAHIARVLNDLGDVGLVTSTHLTGNTLRKVDESSVHPVLPKHTNSLGSDRDTEWRDVGLNHTEGSVGSPEDEEDDKHVVSVPESLVVGSASLLHTGNNHASQGNQHDVSRPARSRYQVGKEETVDTKVVLGSNLSEVVPVSNGVNPAEEEDRPGNGNVEGDVLVELNNAVQWRLTSQGDEGPAHGEQNHGNVEVENQSC